MRRYLAVALIVLAMGAVACGDDDEPTIEGGGATTTAQTGPKTATIDVDAAGTDPRIVTFQFFPKEATFHPGDTVNFKSHFNGEPHTVAFGTSVKAAIEAFNKLTPEQREQEGPPPPEFEKLPSFFPQEDVPTPQIRLNQAAAQACYVESGDPPTSGKCPDQTQEDFKGTESLYNSGFLTDDEDFNVRLADSIAPGTYDFMCLVHFTEMAGKINVVDRAQKAQTPDEIQAAARKDLDDLVGRIKPAVDKAQAEAKPAEVAAGVLGQPAEGQQGFPGEAVVFAPKEVKVPVNGTVTWQVGGLHTITFNAPEDARPAITVAADGDVQLNPKAVTRVGSPEPAEPAEDEDAPPVVVNAGRFDGNGFKNSGDLFGGSSPLQYKVTFTRAGTYRYVCLVHPDMEGTVTVA